MFTERESRSDTTFVAVWNLLSSSLHYCHYNQALNEVLTNQISLFLVGWEVKRNSRASDWTINEYPRSVKAEFPGLPGSLNCPLMLYERENNKFFSPKLQKSYNIFE